MTDRQLASDLAALARDGRQHMPSVGELMLAIDRPAPAIDPLFAIRVARIASGAAAVAGALVVLAFSAFVLAMGPAAYDGGAHAWLGHAMELSPRGVAVALLVLPLAAGVLARRIARRRGGDVERVRGWSVVATAAGITALTLVLLYLLFATPGDDLWPEEDADMLIAAISVALAVLASLALRWRRAGVLAHRAVPVIAVLLFAAAAGAGAWPVARGPLSRGLVALAILVLASWFALRREDRAR